MDPQDIELRLKALEVAAFHSAPNYPSPTVDTKTAGAVERILTSLKGIEARLDSVERRHIPSISHLVGLKELTAALEPLIKEMFDGDKALESRIQSTLGQAAGDVQAAKQLQAAHAQAARDILVARAAAFAR
jgi:hypothetical protein